MDFNIIFMCLAAVFAVLSIVQLMKALKKK